MSNRVKCKLCNKPCEDFAKSHIIPRGFFSNTLVPREKGLGVCDVGSFCATGEGRRLRNALYDTNILCLSCEHDIMAPLDNYAIQIYRDFKNANWFNISSFDKDVRVVAERNGIGDSKIDLMRNVDRRRLRAFFASLLWRCHVSTLHELSLVDIGSKYERLIREELLCENFQKDRAFDYIDAVAFSFTSIAHECLTMPFKKRYCVNGIEANGYTLQLPHLGFRVSIDQRRNPYDWGHVCLGVIADEICEGAMSLHKEYETDNLLVFQTKEAFHQMEFVRGEFHKYFVNRSVLWNQKKSNGQ